MNIAPNPLPATALTAEVPRPTQPPAHESSRPVVAPNPAEAMAQEARRDDAQRTGHRAERKLEHNPQTHGQHTRQKTARAATAADSATTPEPRPNKDSVGALLDVFA